MTATGLSLTSTPPASLDCANNMTAIGATSASPPDAKPRVFPDAASKASASGTTTPPLMAEEHGADDASAGWTSEEDEILEHCVRYGMTDWGDISRCVPGKSAERCRRRWEEGADDRSGGTAGSADDAESAGGGDADSASGGEGRGRQRGRWMDEEDRVLIDSQARFGNQWTRISKLLPGRSENAVKNRFKSTYIQRLVQQNADGSASPPHQPTAGGSGAGASPDPATSSVQHVVTQAGASRVTIVGKPLAGGGGGGSPPSSSPAPPPPSSGPAAATSTSAAAVPGADPAPVGAAAKRAPPEGPRPPGEEARLKKRARVRPSRSKAAVAQRERERALERERDGAAARSLLPPGGTGDGMVSGGEAALIRRGYALGYARGVKGQRKKGGHTPHPHPHKATARFPPFARSSDAWSEGVQWEFDDPDEETTERCLPGSLEHALYEHGVDIDFYSVITDNIQEHYTEENPKMPPAYSHSQFHY